MNTSDRQGYGLGRGLIAELTVHCDDGSLATLVALDWLTVGVQMVSGGFDVQMVSPEVEVSGQGYKHIPEALLEGEPGGVWGYIAASPADSWDVLYNPYVEAALPWLQEQVEKRAESVAVKVGSVRPDGTAGPTRARLSVAFDEELEHYVRLRCHVEEQALLDAETGADHQRRLESVLLRFARAYPVVFGHVAYDSPDGQTELEKCLRGMQSDPAANTVERPDRLRGYSWIMVASKSAARGLAGAEGLRATGAFADIEALPNGSLWLKATDDYRDYNASHVRKVWQAVKDVLIPGDPQPPRAVPGRGPAWMVVFDS
jgi:hypothetical protein